MNVSAKDLGTGKHQEITLTQSSNMSSAEIDAAIRDAEKYAAEDAKRKKSAELRNHAEELLYQAKTAQKKLSSQDKERIETLRKQVQSALDGKDDYALKNACDELTQALQAVGRYVDDASVNADDGSMDADYTTND